MNVSERQICYLLEPDSQGFSSGRQSSVYTLLSLPVEDYQTRKRREGDRIRPVAMSAEMIRLGGRLFGYPKARFSFRGITLASMDDTTKKAFIDLSTYQKCQSFYMEWNKRESDYRSHMIHTVTFLDKVTGKAFTYSHQGLLQFGERVTQDLMMEAETMVLNGISKVVQSLK